MFCLAIEILIKKTMTNHDFVFDNKILRQNEGGSIGLSLTGDVANIYMSHWDKIFRSRLLDVGIELIIQKRYVDDINIIAEEKTEESDNGKYDETIMKKVQLEANAIHPSIKTTIDYCSNYEDRKLPMLDLKIWIGKNKDGQLKIMHEHYIKDVTTRSLIHYTSSHPPNTKMNVMVNEARRILRNCSTELEWIETVSHLNYFVKRMQFSGYPKDIRYKVIKRAIDKYDKEEKRRNEDERRFKPSIETRKERENQKDKKRRWYQKEGKYEGVMFVEATKDSELQKRIQISAKRNNIKIKVQERSGTKLKRILQRSDPFSKKECNRDTCMICVKKLGINCRTRGCVYQIMCQDCKIDTKKKNKYRGQTGRSVHERMNEHFNLWETKSEKSVLWQHSMEHHNSKEFPVEAKILSRCFGKPTKRLITEVVMIEEMTDTEGMNNKAEYGYVRMPKVSVEEM